MRNIRTDLAMEAREWFKEQKQNDMDGVESEEFKNGKALITRVEIKNQTGSEKLGKPIGKYVTIEDRTLLNGDVENEEKLAKILSDELVALLPEHRQGTILVVGLGNRHVTPDALGPRVVQDILVTRHILTYMPDAIDERLSSVCAIAPGVLGLTGIETSEMIRAIVEKVKPVAIIAIDALAARKIERLGTSIQISNTGISPGSGIENMRTALNQETLGVPVIAVGVPTVIYASNITHDTIYLLQQEIEKDLNADKNIQDKQREGIVNRVHEQVLGGRTDMVVTPKEIDELIEDIAYVLAAGLNAAVHHRLPFEEVLSYTR